MRRLAASLAVGSLLAGAATSSTAQGETLGPDSPDNPNSENTEAAPSPDDELLRWSATPLLQLTRISSGEANDDVGGYFDQYLFTPNKSSAAPFELGLRDGSLDLLNASDSPLLQVRFQSPTSNLGVSGSQIDQPFFNQRLYALGRVDALSVDLEYWRFRTEQLRRFPNTAGAGLLFDDQTRPDDRFYRDRTGFFANTRLRLGADSPADSALARLRPVLALRGGYESRGGLRQLRFHRDPTGDWLGVRQNLDRSVSDIGTGLLLVPAGPMTLSLDFDYERFRFGSALIDEGELGYPPPQSTRTVGFMPESDRYTGTLRLASALGERARFEAGFRISQLDQAGRRTPDQQAAGLVDIHVRHYSADATVDVRLDDDWSLNGFFDFDLRDKDIPRNTPLFSPSDGTQFGPFLERSQRFVIGGELERRFGGRSRASLGIRYEDVDRDLDFVPPGTPRILSENAHIRRDSRFFSVYGRTALRPWRTLRIDAKLGYRIAPDTGYIVDLDDHVFGELRASYLIPWTRSLLLTGFVRGSTGKNDDFRLVSGAGPNPAGPVLPRSYERSTAVWGFTGSLSPVDRLQLFASFFMSWDDQTSGLDLSSLQRYFQDFGPFGFANSGSNRFEDEQLSLIIGSHMQFDPRTDGRFGYSFTRIRARYESAATPELALIEANHVIDALVHGLDFELGRRVMRGLRVFAGYRLQLYDDRAPPFESIQSAVAPFDRSTHQHTVSLGVTLTSEFFEG